MSEAKQTDLNWPDCSPDVKIEIDGLKFNNISDFYRFCCAKTDVDTEQECIAACQRVIQQIHASKSSTENLRATESVSETDPGLHYRYEYKGIKLDPYRIAEIYNINDFALQTILKKVLRAGRAHKDLKQDLKDIISAAERRLEMLEEDET